MSTSSCFASPDYEEINSLVCLAIGALKDFKNPYLGHGLRLSEDHQQGFEKYRKLDDGERREYRKREEDLRDYMVSTVRWIEGIERSLIEAGNGETK
jgi:hypothetical protein